MVLVKAAITLVIWDQGEMYFFLSQKKTPWEQKYIGKLCCLYTGDLCGKWGTSDEVLLVRVFFTISLIDCNFGISALTEWKSLWENISKIIKEKHTVCLKFLGLGIFILVLEYFYT